MYEYLMASLNYWLVKAYCMYEYLMASLNGEGLLYVWISHGFIELLTGGGLRYEIKYLMTI